MQSIPYYFISQFFELFLDRKIGKKLTTKAHTYTHTKFNSPLKYDKISLFGNYTISSNVSFLNWIPVNFDWLPIHIFYTIWKEKNPPLSSVYSSIPLDHFIILIESVFFCWLRTKYTSSRIAEKKEENYRRFEP